MSERYKQKEYELKSAIDNINSISYIFEDYVKETNDYIDRLLEETKEINVLRNIIKEVRTIIYEHFCGDERQIGDDWCYDEYCIYTPMEKGEAKELLEMLDKEN